jgi:hypothetical protein
MLTVFLATIAFGPPGPAQQKTYSDNAVRAQIVYRISHDRQYDTGPAAVSPSISTGTLTFTANGRRRSYDLARILPLHEHRIIFPEKPNQGCGAIETLSRRGRYLIIETIYAEKGCRADATFIDIASGLAARPASLDWTWDHRLDVLPARFAGSTGWIERLDVIRLTQMWPDFSDHPRPNYKPWVFVVLQYMDSSGQMALLSYESLQQRLDGSADNGQSVRPKVGDLIRVGNLDDPNRPFDNSQSVIRLDAAANKQYASLQAPVQPDLARRVQRNEWFSVADARADRGDLDGAVQAFANVVRLEDDPTLVDSETSMLNRCRAFVPDALMRHRDRHAIMTLWANGCTR